MQRVTSALTPTDMANMAFCERLFYITKFYPQHGTATTYPLVSGSFEHEVFRLLAEKFDFSWRKNPKISLTEASQTDLTETLEYAYSLAIQSHPQFANDLKNSLPELRFRLGQWIIQKQILLKKIQNDGYTRDYAISTILPWKTEDKLFSEKFGLYGRVDAIYNDGRSLIPEDIKTHASRFSTLLHQNAHKAQLLAYTLLLEEKYNIPSTEARILYSKDMSYAEFKATSEAKTKLVKQLGQARELLDGEIPPLLQGEESIKCKHCYARTQCMKLAKEQPDIAWVDRLFNQNFDQTGGNSHEN